MPDDRAETGSVGRRGHLGHVDADGAAEETGRRAHHEAAEVEEDRVSSGGLYARCGLKFSQLDFNFTIYCTFIVRNGRRLDWQMLFSLLALWGTVVEIDLLV